MGWSYHDRHRVLDQQVLGIRADEKVADWAKIIGILRENEEPAWLGNRRVWLCAAFIGGTPHLLVLGEGFWDPT